MNRNRPPIVCLCGSTKFKNEFEEVNRDFTLNGYIVLSVGFYMHADEIQIESWQKALIDALHKKKIEMADFIYVINPRGYIGESTKSEIAFARNIEKPIDFLFKDDELYEPTD